VIVWDLRTGQHATLAGHTQPVTAVACTRLEDGTPIAITGAGGSGGGPGEVIVWDLRTGQHATLAGHTQPVTAVACTRLEDGTPIAITGGGEVIVWNLRTGRMQQTLAVPYPVGALCCDSRQGVVIGTAAEIVRLQHERPVGSSGPAQAPGHPRK
jgi:WD40 repeat protein